MRGIFINASAFEALDMMHPNFGLYMYEVNACPHVAHDQLRHEMLLHVRE